MCGIDSQKGSLSVVCFCRAHSRTNWRQVYLPNKYVCDAHMLGAQGQCRSNFHKWLNYSIYLIIKVLF